MLLSLIDRALSHWLTLLYTCIGLAVFFTAVLVVYYTNASRRPRNFPPGPPTLPVLGNLHIFPTNKGCLKFHEWGLQYGSIIGLKLGPQNVVILNDYRHVQELLDRRGSLYSDRPQHHIANDLIYKNETHILFATYGDNWKAQRKAASSILNTTTVEQLVPIQTAEANQSMYQIISDPEGWYDHIRRFTTAVTLASIYGLRGESFESPRVKSVYHALEQSIALLELGATPPIDIFRFLRYLPSCLASWKGRAKKIREEHQALFTKLKKDSESQMQRKTDLNCLMSRLINDREKIGLDDEHITYFASTMLEAASDTTTSTLLSFILAMVKNPRVLAKCQEEVDRVCGTNNSPSLDNSAQLVYLNATMNEVIRWRPVAAGGIPHALIQDDYYQGYFLPKGTIVIPNTWSIHRTEEFANADEFRPERFLDNKFGIKDSSTYQENNKRRVLYGWGAGRRICAGQAMAENSLILIIAKLVWTFDIKPETDIASIDDSVETGYHGGFTLLPKRFPAKFTPRSPTHSRIVTDEYTASEQFLSRFNFKE